VRAWLVGEFLLEACCFQEARELLLNPTGGLWPAVLVVLAWVNQAMVDEEGGELFLIEAAQGVVQRMPEC